MLGGGRGGGYEKDAGIRSRRLSIAYWIVVHSAMNRDASFGDPSSGLLGRSNRLNAWLVNWLT